MKKAKLILAALVLFAGVGGALAFKANRGMGTMYLPNLALSFVSGGVTYYSAAPLTQKNFVVTTTGTPTLYYFSTALIGTRTAFVNPTTTAGLAVIQ